MASFNQVILMGNLMNRDEREIASGVACERSEPIRADKNQSVKLHTIRERPFDNHHAAVSKRAV